MEEIEKMKSDAATRTRLDSGTTKKRERNLRLVLVMISVAAFPWPRINRTKPADNSSHIGAGLRRSTSGVGSLVAGG